jgi:Limiting CO2-inducible proteins B/C beta carbonyic anhydrases
LPPSSFRSNPQSKIAKVFPKSVPNSQLVEKVAEKLSAAGFDKANTLVATSLCCDELVRPLEKAIGVGHYGEHFTMGGLAGFPHGGHTAFMSMCTHIPDCGHCLMVYGPHVGVDSKGTVGTVERPGRLDGGPCCGSATAACGHVLNVRAGANPQDGGAAIFDAQQANVVTMLTPYGDRLAAAASPDDLQVELSYSLQDAQQKMIETIVVSGASYVPDGMIAVLGGIQINTPPEMEDFYWPKHLDLYDNKGVKQDELLWS